MLGKLSWAAIPASPIPLVAGGVVLPSVDGGVVGGRRLPGPIFSHLASCSGVSQ